MKKLPKRKIYRYCLADIAKGLFNGMIGNYLLYFLFHSKKCLGTGDYYG